MSKSTDYALRKAERGICRFCGCSHFDPCPMGCGWQDRAETLCTSLECVAGDHAEHESWKRHTSRNRAFRQAHRRGFLTGFYGLSRKNPYADHRGGHHGHVITYSRAFIGFWNDGYASGKAARREFVKREGPVSNMVRAELLMTREQLADTRRKVRTRMRGMSPEERRQFAAMEALSRGKRTIWIDFVDETPVATPGPTPKCEHTPAPVGYNNWHGWAERMSKTHRQKRCSHCGLWAIWVPKGPKRPRATKKAIAKALEDLAR